MASETEFGNLIKGFFRNYPDGNRSAKEDYDDFKDYMGENGFKQVVLSEGDTRLLLMNTYLSYIGDDRESYYGEKPFACVKTPKNINTESGPAVGALLRKMFGRENARRIRGSRTTLPYWSATVDAGDPHWPGGKTTRVDIVNDGEDEITKECFVFF